MGLYHTINRNFSGSGYVLILSVYLALVTGCSQSDERAAQSAAQAQSYLNQNRIADARVTINNAIRADDDVSDYYIILGRIEYAAEGFENAFAAYSEALALDGTNEEALQAISQIGLRIGLYDESKDATNKLLVLNPNQKNALLTNGQHALIGRNYAQALNYADNILSLDGLDEGGVVLKARATFLAGNTMDAVHILDDYEAARPNTAAVSLTRLEIYRKLRDADRVAKQFAELERLLPNDFTLRLDEANFRFKTANAVRANIILARMLASKQATQKNISDAIGLWQEYAVSSLDVALVRSIAKTGTTIARIESARYFAKAGDRAAAKLFIQGMVGSDAKAERANLALLGGNTLLAKSLSSNILALDTTHCAALGTNANILQQSGRLASALRSAQRASLECPNRPYLWQLTALAYSSLGDQSNARRVFRQGIDANKQSEPLTRAYSFWSLARGKDREAIAAARRLTRSAPALTSGWRLYLEICTKANSGCTAEANTGLIDSKTRYELDFLPAELPSSGLFGRFITR